VKASFIKMQEDESKPLKRRLRMEISLANFEFQDEMETLALEIRPNHWEAIGCLMYNAYLDTVDYDGETVEDAKVEVSDTMSGKYGTVLYDASRCIEGTSFPSIIASAVIFTQSGEQSNPLLVFAMTEPSYQGQGYCTKLLKHGLHVLSGQGFNICELVVTSGNPAIRIYERLGFKLKLGS
jgi:GNAT superfamily N-acetyltransferase